VPRVSRKQHWNVVGHWQSLFLVLEVRRRDAKYSFLLELLHTSPLLILPRVVKHQISSQLIEAARDNPFIFTRAVPFVNRELNASSTPVFWSTLIALFSIQVGR
jgi:hypothetical protein